ncbi:NRDE family protein [Psychrobacter sp. I-STPA6b]|uniref:NRDE family protein n=1 Tax=Psychrobacter sp. I-STPA6b TaxID=2585718 RepID=UPI001D0BF693|nr:NRDE family protein [Psychrobacter sp. I-STPA6b]
MCIVAIAWQLFDNLPLVLLSNRDEFFQRPTQQTQQWTDMPIFAGRDQQSHGTWLGYQQLADGRQNGRWATVLNFRDGIPATPEQRSRGELVTEFLNSSLSPIAFARQLNLQDYAGFNLIVGDEKQAVVVNNRGYPPTPLFAGLHVFSNGQPESEWFKCERLRGRVRQEVLPLIAEDSQVDYWKDASFDVLSDTQQAPDGQLPSTGIAPEIEQALSSVFIQPFVMPNNSHYGTRTQSILYMQSLQEFVKLALITNELTEK